MGKRILFIWGPNSEMLPAAHRTLGSTQWIEARTGITCPHCDGFDHYAASEIISDED